MLSFANSRPQGQIPLGFQSNLHCFTFFPEQKPLIQIVVTVGPQTPFLFHMPFSSPIADWTRVFGTRIEGEQVHLIMWLGWNV